MNKAVLLFIVLFPLFGLSISLTNLSKKQMQQNESIVNSFEAAMEINNALASLSGDLFDPKDFSGGTGVGNGGDGLSCNGSSFFLDHYVSKKFYEYHLMKDAELANNFKLRDVHFLEESLAEVEISLRKFDTSIADQFNEFYTTFLSFAKAGENGSSKVRWAIADTSYLKHFPVETKKLEIKLNEECQGVKVFLRSAFSISEEMLSASFDSEVILFNAEFISNLSDIDLSYALVHEFLWAYTRVNSSNFLERYDAKIIRGINSYLHSEKILVDDTATIKRTLGLLGLNSKSANYEFSVDTITNSNNYYIRYNNLKISDQSNIRDLIILIDNLIVQGSSDIEGLLLIDDILKHGLTLSLLSSDILFIEELTSKINLEDDSSNFDMLGLQTVTMALNSELRPALNDSSLVSNFVNLAREYMLSSSHTILVKKYLIMQLLRSW